MESKDNQEFLSRGCRCAPQPHSRQLDVFAPPCNKLNATDWLKELKPPPFFPSCNIVEVRFKNSRKEFFQSPPELELEIGDIVAVEGSPGHDIGIVTLTGEVVRLQVKNKKTTLKTTDFKSVYRKAKVSDIEKWVTVVKLEDSTMYRARGMASSLKLSMKISDVEYQGDRTKATFYYTADDRVDFRELIRVLADAFHVRIEMRQIGMRQEASRLGGIGSCGRELCCATWLTNFRSVSTNAARTQQLSLNPHKLAEQCSKLKCCINYENDCYVDAMKGLPELSVDLVTKKGTARFQKHDVLKRQLGYAYRESPGQVVMLQAERVKEIIQMNRENQFPEDLLSEEMAAASQALSGQFEPNLEDSLTRFDEPKKTRKRRRKKKK
ncbi:MAG: regulatory iron-sulfur-containing complex subunit RicT [Bacteroidales bacterium]